MATDERINVGLIGYGYWGPNIARNVHENSGMNLLAIADLGSSNRGRAKQNHPSSRVYDNSDDILNDENIQAVVISTPAETHFNLCNKAINSGMHVLVTKPVSCSLKETEMIVSLAKKKSVVFLVDHTFLYSPPVSAIKKIIESNVLGEILYVESIRSGLGIFKDDVNVIDDLAVHDVAILNHIFPVLPREISCLSHRAFKKLKESLSHMTLYYKDGMVAHISSHWFSPVKQRQFIISGDKKMLVWDDTQLNDKVKIYDAGLEFNSCISANECESISYRQNGGVSVELENSEPLSAEVNDFLHCIQTNDSPVSGGLSAINASKVIDAAHRSEASNGVHTKIHTGINDACLA